jgi:hypothetical protein
VLIVCRRQLQNEMIEKGVVNWLVKLFRDSDSVSDYMLEYAVALLMNLCLRTAGMLSCDNDARRSTHFLLLTFVSYSDLV